MKNNQMIIINEDSIFYKIKRYFKNFINRIFGKNKNIETSNYIEEKETKVEENKEFLDNIKVDNNEVDKVVKKRDFLEEINGNVELLQNLSISRLKQLEKYYDSIIEENSIKISKLSQNA